MREERFEVTGASVTFRVGAKERNYQPGEVAVVPAGVPHVWWNSSDREAATLVQFRPALDTETFFETYFGLASEGRVGKNGLPNPLQMMLLARHFRREMALPRPQQTILGPIAMIVSPLARALGYRGRYDRFSGPSSATKY